jgi:hypothetical protein
MAFWLRYHSGISCYALMWFYRLEGRIVKLVVRGRLKPASKQRDVDLRDSTVTVLFFTEQRGAGHGMGMLAIRTGLTNIKCCLLK